MNSRKLIADENLGEIRLKLSKTPSEDELGHLLWWAAGNCQHQTVKLLISHGASVAYRTVRTEIKGETALHEACINGYDYMPPPNFLDTG